jgi:hypothetical protein
VCALHAAGIVKFQAGGHSLCGLCEQFEDQTAMPLPRSDVECGSETVRCRESLLDHPDDEIDQPIGVPRCVAGFQGGVFHR